MIRIPIALFIATLLSLVACTRSDNVPQIVCEVNSVLPGLPGDKIEYVFTVSSKKPLQSIEVFSDAHDGNAAAFKHNFENQVFSETVNYSYIVPKNIENTSFVQLKIVLRDEDGMNVTVQILPVYNPPQMADGLGDVYFE